MNFYISDLHLGHKRVLRMDDRPFETLDEMNNAIINNWNSRVGNNDTVYILGDIAWSNSEAYKVISQLTGTKVLILGNHDKLNDGLKGLFSEIVDYKVINDNYKGKNNQLVLSHYPIAHWYNQFRNSIHLYGHVHSNKDWIAYKKYGEHCKAIDIPFRAYNVGCMIDYIDYTPRTLDEILSANEIDYNI